jgi:hypothetical protein
MARAQHRLPVSDREQCALWRLSKEELALEVSIVGPLRAEGAQTRVLVGDESVGGGGALDTAGGRGSLTHTTV